MNLYDFTVKDNLGKDVSLSKFRGKVLLIVNTATGCGFTPQYAGLQELYDKYKEKGLEILDFPCNQFASQAPGSDEEISKFCTLNYNTTFPRFKKIEVNGENAEPLYKFLKEKQKGLGKSDIKWNFTKFLADKSGNIVKRFAPITTPAAMETDIEELLK
jgi:glutathione peroxidase